MDTWKRLPVVLLSAALVAGCAGNGPKEQSGMVIGGVLGGALGSQIGGRGNERTAAIIAGTLAGAAIGGSVGRSMDDTDRLKMGQTLETVRTGVPSAWRNPDTGVSYQMTPRRTYEAPSGPCRDYTVDAVIEGKRETVHGTACRQPDGTWRTTG